MMILSLTSLIEALFGLLFGMLYGMQFCASVQSRYHRRDEENGHINWQRLLLSKTVKYLLLAVLAWLSLQWGVAHFLVALTCFMIGFWLSCIKQLKGTA